MRVMSPSVVATFVAALAASTWRPRKRRRLRAINFIIKS